MPDDRALGSFVGWLSAPEQGVTLHPALEIRSEGRDGGYGVYSTTAIATDEIIMKVAKTSLLSARNSAISNIMEDAELDGMLAVCLAFLYERAQEGNSPWHAYIQICPRLVPISKLWNREEQKMLKGTEVAMVGGTTLRDFKDLYKERVKPFLADHATELGSFKNLSFEMFCEGMSIVGSRAFEIDAYHGLALCPFADMLDHEIHEDVHFQTTYDVCPECGESGGCEHDPESSSSSQDDEDDDESLGDGPEALQRRVERINNIASPAIPHDTHDSGSDGEENEENEEEEDTCDFVVIRPIRANHQVMNTYGECGNDVLLARYGFSLLDNPHDKISLGPEVVHRYKSKIHLEWWKLNGRNLLRALKIPQSAESEMSEDAESDVDSFMQEDSDSQDDDNDEDEDVELEDLLHVSFDGGVSETLLHFLLLQTISATALETKTGPELKIQFEILLSAWRYMQPGRLPLPKYLFLDAVRSVIQVLDFLTPLVRDRVARYQSFTDQLNLDTSEAAIDALAEYLRHMTPESEKDSKLRFATIVRLNEISIMKRCQTYINSIKSAGHWLLERDVEDC